MLPWPHQAAIMHAVCNIINLTSASLPDDEQIFIMVAAPLLLLLLPPLLQCHGHIMQALCMHSVTLLI